MENLGGLGILLFLSLLNTSISFSQSVKISVSGSTDTAVLFQLEGEKTNMLDSISSQDGKYQFSLRDKAIGLYRLQFEGRHGINFKNDGKDVVLKTDYNNMLDSLKVIY